MSEGSAGGQDSRPGGELPAGYGDEVTQNILEGQAGRPAAAGSAPAGTSDGPGTAQRAESAAADDDTYGLYRRGLDLLSRGSPAAASQLLERASAAEPNSRSILEALARAQFDARRYAAAAGSFKRIVDASPSDDYAHFGLGLALSRTGEHFAAAEHLALAAAMRPDLRHYTEALRSVRATLRARGRVTGQETL